MEENEKNQEEIDFNQWCVIQLMGHVSYAGYVESVIVFGKHLMRLTVPAVEGDRSIPKFTKLISPNALYDITPVSEAFAIKMAARLRKAPLEDYAHNEVIKEMAKDYVKQMEASEVAAILLNGENQKHVAPIIGTAY